MAKKKTKQRSATKPKQTGGSRPSQPGKSARATKKPNDSRQRLQRVMASAGIGSRRECELIIEEGRVEVDGQIVMTLGAKVDPQKQEIYVDAQKLVIQRLQYFILNKPPGVLSTSKDPSGRPRVIDLIKTDKRVYNVGRLDQSSEGLILVTNDGDLANHLTHPRYGVEKKYHVQVAGVPTAEELRKLEEGVYIAEGLARATKAKKLKRAPGGCWLEIVLAEGRNREIRRMLAGIDHKVRTLKRVAIGPLKLGDLPLGAHRPLTSMEIKMLKKSSAETTKPRRRRPTRKKTVAGSARSDSDRSATGASKSRKTNKRSASKPSERSRSASGKRGEAKNAGRSGGKKAGSRKPPRAGSKSKKRSSKRK